MGETFNLLTLPLSLFQAGAGEITEILIVLLIQLSIILAAAKIAGEVATRFLKVPAVLAELGVGVAIGPFALGGLSYFGVGPLFPIPLVDGKPSPIPGKQRAICPGSAWLHRPAVRHRPGNQPASQFICVMPGRPPPLPSAGWCCPLLLGVPGQPCYWDLTAAAGWTSPQALFMGAINDCHLRGHHRPGTGRFASAGRLRRALPSSPPLW